MAHLVIAFLEFVGVLILAVGVGLLLVWAAEQFLSEFTRPIRIVVGVVVSLILIAAVIFLLSGGSFLSA